MSRMMDPITFPLASYSVTCTTTTQLPAVFKVKFISPVTGSRVIPGMGCAGVYGTV
jgi:hypothetical protein